jgi:type IV pilus assembly protein PilA
MMIVVAIIGLLLAVSIPSMLRAGNQARKNRFAQEIRTAGHAFVQYSLEHGEYPADKTPAIMPDGMDEYLTRFAWTEETPVGGQWDWDYGVFGIHAAVSVKDPNWGSDKMQAVDSILDDGNLSTGQFRSRSGGYMYILEETAF